MDAESEFLATLAGFAARADEHAARVIATGNRDAIARSASALAECRSELAEVEESLKRAIPPLVAFGEKPIVEGLGEVIVRSGKKRTGWRKADMAARAVGIIADEAEHFHDPESGEQRPRADTTRRVIDRFLEFFSLANPKLGGWKAAKIDPDDYADVEDGATTVQLPSRKGRAPGEVVRDGDEGF